MLDIATYLESEVRRPKPVGDDSLKLALYDTITISFQIPSSDDPALLSITFQ